MDWNITAWAFGHPHLQKQQTGKQDMKINIFKAVKIIICVAVQECGQDSAVSSTVICYGLDSPGIGCQWGRDFPCCPDQPWGPTNLLYDGYRVLPWGTVAKAQCWSCISFLCQLANRLEVYLLFPLCLHRHVLR